MARITIEILRPVPLAPLTVTSRVVRPGRNVELVEAVLAEPGDGAEATIGARHRVAAAATKRRGRARDGGAAAARV